MAPKKILRVQQKPNKMSLVRLETKEIWSTKLSRDRSASFDKLPTVPLCGCHVQQ